MREIRVPVWVLVLMICGRALAQVGWYPQDSGTSSTLYDVFSVDSLQCWVVGWQHEIRHTDDGGQTWSLQTVADPGAYTGVWFVDQNAGWACATSGQMVHTLDGGDNWTAQESGTYVDLWDIQFLDSSNGWAVGGQYYVYFGNVQIILNTSDGGATWETNLYETYEPTLRGVYFANASTGYAAGDQGTILGTTNGWATWTEQESGVPFDFEDIWFASATTGCAVGEGGAIVRTEDGGNTWTPVTSGTGAYLRGICFADPTHGWIAGGTETDVQIRCTTDAGMSWQTQYPGSDNWLRSVHFSDLNHGWAVGTDGTIVHTTDGGVPVESQESCIGPSLLYELQSCPQPFSSHATISFSLGETSSVRAEIFDLSGRLQRALLDEELTAGEHSVLLTAEGLQSGLYLCRISTGSESATVGCMLVR